MNDKFNTFLNLWNGKPCKVLPDTISGKQTPQCFDLAVAWTDLLGVPHYPGNPSPFPYMNASQIYTDFSSWQGKYFDRLVNTPDAIPQKGDLIVWSSSYNRGKGHVAIATGLNTDLNHFQALQQNDPNPYTQLKDYNYSYVLGWLRFKTPAVPIDDCPAKLLQITAERDKLNGVIEGKDKIIIGLQAEMKVLNKKLSDIKTLVNS